MTADTTAAPKAKKVANAKGGAKAVAKPKAGGNKKGGGASGGGAKAPKLVKGIAKAPKASISIEKSRSRVKAWTGIKGQGQYGLFPYKDAKGLALATKKAKEFLRIK